MLFSLLLAGLPQFGRRMERSRSSCGFTRRARLQMGINMEWICVFVRETTSAYKFHSDMPTEMGESGPLVHGENSAVRAIAVLYPDSLLAGLRLLVVDGDPRYGPLVMKEVQEVAVRELRRLLWYYDDEGRSASPLLLPQAPALFRVVLQEAVPGINLRPTLDRRELV